MNNKFDTLHRILICTIDNNIDNGNKCELEAWFQSFDQRDR